LQEGHPDTATVDVADAALTAIEEKEESTVPFSVPELRAELLAIGELLTL
jgi:hypothetical protein